MPMMVLTPMIGMHYKNMSVMNRIFRFIYVALIVFAAVACHTSEIDDPNNDNPDKPKISENIKFTARIQQTRVGYAPHGSQLEQRWMVGDVIYGFYGGSTANKVVFSVESVDEETGVATLDPGDGWSGFISAFKANNSLSIGLVYTGSTSTKFSELFDENDAIVIDMTSQGTERIPACMHAESFGIDNKREEDVTYVIFEFKNDCSIIEVFSFTGVKEDSDEYFDGESATLGSIAVDGLIEGCQYSLDKDGFLQFESIDKTDDDDAPTTVTLGGSWSVTEDGDITYGGNIKPVYIAAVPFEYEEFTVSAYLDGGKQPIILPAYENKELKGGNSYYIKANPVVAKTVDDVYFKTVYEAFEHAKYLDGNPSLLDGKDNTVTLIAGDDDEPGDIYGLVDHNDSDSIDETIVIDYPVTLNLNGRWLYLGNIKDFYADLYDDMIVSESFSVDDGGEFTITDLGAGENPGQIWSDGNSAESIIKNKGTVIIENGGIDQWGSDDVDDPILIDNNGSLTVERGSLFSCGSVIDSEAGSETYIGVENDTNIDQDDRFDYKLSINSYGNSISIHSDDTAETIFEIRGGCVSGKEVAVKLDGKNVNGYISGGNIIGGSKYSTALLVNSAKCTISGGVIAGDNTQNTDRTNKTYGLKLVDAECIIEGGIIDGKSYSYAVYSENSKCTISDGTIKSTSYTDGDPYSDYAGIPTIYCSTTESPQEVEYLFDMSGGSVEGNGLKLFLDNNVNGRITGGNFQTTGNHAIQLSGAILNIDGTDNTIDISNGSTKAGGPSYSTISIGNGSNCTISGEKATISNSTNGYAVEIIDSECMLSGGKFVNNSANYPAIYCYRSTEGTTTDLTIKWAEDSSDLDSLREGPLIVCTYDPGQSGLTYLGAVSTKKLVVYADENDEVGTTFPNYAKVDISGGYLYAKNGAFYSQSQEGSLSITGSFYTNLGSLISPIKSPYFDFTQECLKYVSSEIVDVDYGDYNFDHKIIPGGEPDVDIDITGGSLPPYGKEEL